MDAGISIPDRANGRWSGGYIARIRSLLHALASPIPFVVDPETAGAEQNHRNEGDYNEQHPREGHSVAQPEVAERVVIEVQHVAQRAVLRSAVGHDEWLVEPLERGEQAKDQ